jgi:intraflagellar transport protein 122
LECFKLAKYAYEKLSHMRLPSKWQDSVDFASFQLRSQKNEDKGDFLVVCAQCNFQNAAFNSKSQSCVNCQEPYVLSFYSFENLPLVQFLPTSGISEIECENLIKTQPEETEAGKDDFKKMLESFDRSGNGSYRPIEFNRQQLLGCDPNKVFIRKWGPVIPKEYYLLKTDDVFIILCPSCQHFFVEDEWNYQILLEGRCPFCRTNVL